MFIKIILEMNKKKTKRKEIELKSISKFQTRIPVYNISFKY